MRKVKKKEEVEDRDRETEKDTQTDFKAQLKPSNSVKFQNSDSLMIAKIPLIIPNWKFTLYYNAIMHSLI